MALIRIVLNILQSFPIVETLCVVLTFAGAIGGVVFSEGGWNKPIIDFAKTTAADYFEMKFYEFTAYRSKFAEPVLQVYPILRWVSFIVCTVLGSMLGAAIGYLLYRMTRTSTVIDGSEHARNFKTKRFVARIVFGIFSLALIATTFLWGNYLLGVMYGALYGIIAAALLGILAQLLVFNEKPLLIPSVFVVAVSVMAGYLIVRPTALSLDFQYLIDMQATDRTVRAELAAVFATEDAFSDLSISTMHLKCVNVTIRGSVKNFATLHRLRSRIVSECQELKSWSVLHWDILVREPEQRLDDVDSVLFGKEK